MTKEELVAALTKAQEAEKMLRELQRDHRDLRAEHDAVLEKWQQACTDRTRLIEALAKVSRLIQC